MGHPVCESIRVKCRRCEHFSNHFAVIQVLFIPGLPYYVHVFIVSSTSGVAFFVGLLYARRWLLRILLSYTGWMCMCCSQH